MVLEMKAETMQIALTLSSYHDDQPPELGGKSQKRSAGGKGGGKRDMCVCVLVSQFAKSSMCLLNTHCRPSVVEWLLHWEAQFRRR